ncbi:dioxygenase [Neisseria animalis]|uniref:Dioxygenase n=1 Tax=Neisseria animalis TaxID=492 RepID=A0A5P3MSI3_NEIAN|nr:dioxygenase [Neisseria animalis]QEY24562.1 dioxygenase [Neisseria animalis]ROW33128.1 dioxygenase [Neisseria animalis]VEE07367.1 Putative ring dioxygenase subunit beta [Neisseria animalis]
MSELLDLIQTESVGIVEETLDFWLYECSLDDAPTPEDVAHWREILQQRGGKFVRLANICQTWLDEEA